MVYSKQSRYGLANKRQEIDEQVAKADNVGSRPTHSGHHLG